MSASANFPAIPKDWIQKSENILKGRVRARIWMKPKRQTGRFLFLVHGQGEQSDRYEHFPFYLSSSVDAIGILDLPGHGKSKGRRGHINNFDQYSTAVLEAFKWTLSEAESSLGKDLERHWCGHSMGGLITLRTMLRKQDLRLRSVCVSAPLLGLALKVPPLKKLFAILVEPFLGKISMSSKMNAENLSHDPSVGVAYLANPLNHDMISPRFFVQLQREMELLKAPIAEFPYNLMMLVPLQDKIVSWKAAFQFFHRIKMKTACVKELQSFPHFDHEAFNELEKDRAFLCLENWILKNTLV
jgi:lysophospholipase